jgi:hypothetical protein
MAVIRVNKTADYTVISNTHFKEKEMSLKAKGLLSLMLSLPDDWNYSIAGLVTLSKDGKESVISALNELEQFGYLRRTKALDEKKRFAGYDYDIYEKPQAEKPFTENPHTGNTKTENPPQLNTNISNTNQSNTNQLNTEDNNISAEFDELWELYPRKKGKPQALKAYRKARKNGVTFEQVKQGIIDYCRQIEALKTDAEFVRHGSTWFNNEGWNDEYIFTPRKAAASSAPVINDESEYDYDDENDKLERFKGRVYLSENQIADLLDKMEIETFNEYIDRLNNFIIENNVTVRNHYATLLKWYNQDRAVKA